MPADVSGVMLQRAQLELLARLTPEQLAREIRGSSFACSHCGTCCRPNRAESGTTEATVTSLVLGHRLLVPESRGREQQVYNTNRLIVDGPDVRRIAEATGLGFFEIVRPAPTMEYNPDGVARSLLWMLRYKLQEPGLGDCLFYEDGRGCTIYPHRPAVCRFFPFILEQDERNVQVTCACPRGTQADMTEGQAMECARAMLEWYRTYCNLRYALENINLTLDPSQAKAQNDAGWERFRRHNEQGYALYSVLDSDGVHRVRARLKDGWIVRFERM